MNGCQALRWRRDRVTVPRLRSGREQKPVWGAWLVGHMAQETDIILMLRVLAEEPVIPGGGDADADTVARTLYSATLPSRAPLPPVLGDLSRAPSRTTWLPHQAAPFVPLTKHMAPQSSAHVPCGFPVPLVTARMWYHKKEAHDLCLQPPAQAAGRVARGGFQ